MTETTKSPSTLEQLAEIAKRDPKNSHLGVLVRTIVKLELGSILYDVAENVVQEPNQENKKIQAQLKAVLETLYQELDRREKVEY